MNTNKKQILFCYKNDGKFNSYCIILINKNDMLNDNIITTLQNKVSYNNIYIIQNTNYYAIFISVFFYDTFTNIKTYFFEYDIIDAQIYNITLWFALCVKNKEINIIRDNIIYYNDDTCDNNINNIIPLHPNKLDILNNISIIIDGYFIYKNKLYQTQYNPYPLPYQLIYFIYKEPYKEPHNDYIDIFKLLLTPDKVTQNQGHIYTKLNDRYLHVTHINNESKEDYKDDYNTHIKISQNLYAENILQNACKYGNINIIDIIIQYYIDNYPNVLNLVISNIITNNDTYYIKYNIYYINPNIITYLEQKLNN